MWNHFIYNNHSHFDTIALLGDFFHKIIWFLSKRLWKIGLTDQVNNEVYTQITDNHAGFGLAQLNSDTRYINYGII